MVTIAGNGMGRYDFSNLDLDFSLFDKIICDQNFTENGNNILKLKFKDAQDYILGNFEKESILYVVTGSPLFFSAGTIIASKLPKEKVKIINNSSSKSYLLEKLFISENDVSVVSIHGRVSIDLEEFLKKKYTFVLCDKYSIQRLNEALSFFQKDSISTTIGYKLAYEDEKMGKLTMNAGVFSFDAASSDNRIALNFRFPQGTDEKKIQAVLEGLEGVREVSLSQHMHTPHYTPMEDELVSTLLSVYEKQTGLKGHEQIIGGGTFGRLLKRGVAFGAMFPGYTDTMHQANEFADVEDLYRAAAIYAEAIYELIK